MYNKHMTQKQNEKKKEQNETEFLDIKYIYI